MTQTCAVYYYKVLDVRSRLKMIYFMWISFSPKWVLERFTSFKVEWLWNTLVFIFKPQTEIPCCYFQHLWFSLTRDISSSSLFFFLLLLQFLDCLGFLFLFKHFSNHSNWEAQVFKVRHHVKVVEIGVDLLNILIYFFPNSVLPVLWLLVHLTFW